MAIFLRTPVFLITILVYLLLQSDADGTVDDGSAALLVANGGDDVGSTLWNDAIELDRALFQGSQSDGRPQNPAGTQLDSDPEPEDQQEEEPIPQPDCANKVGTFDTAVCCIDDPVPLGGITGSGSVPTLWSLRLCSSCKSSPFSLPLPRKFFPQ